MRFPRRPRNTSRRRTRCACDAGRRSTSPCPPVSPAGAMPSGAARLSRQSVTYNSARLRAERGGLPLPVVPGDEPPEQRVDDPEAEVDERAAPVPVLLRLDGEERDQRPEREPLP